MGSDKPFPVSHIAYGYAAQVVELDDQGKVMKVTAAYDIGTVVNPKAAQGQIEGGIVMGVGYALTEDFPLVDGYPQARYGTLGLIRATDAPEIETILIKQRKQGDAPVQGAKGESLETCYGAVSDAPVHGVKRESSETCYGAVSDAPAYGAKGVGELATIPTAPAVHGAYHKFDGKFRTKLPMESTPYRKK